MTDMDPAASDGPEAQAPADDREADLDLAAAGIPAREEAEVLDIPLPLNLDFMFRLHLHVGTPQVAGQGPGGELRIMPVTGGHFAGPRLRGEVLPGTAADWLRLDPDGTARLDVRLTLRTEGGQVILMSYTGVRTGPEKVLARLAHGEAVPASEYYFRTAIRFETGGADLLWMNRVIAVGTGQRPPEGPVYDVYEVR